ncbi:hypothetical protein Patl1_07637 [Pistacia atlantica]|uniref:Uncharacterized protein n=1 Tax=Pistacia atlantica TaxID=434234 RepID=A0ACC1AGV7_9ROSI|nr:hypothetical protein Patl1_07637 [Pistacia atlantica]
MVALLIILYKKGLAVHLGLPIIAAPHFTVMIGNRNHMRCSGLCENVPLQLDGYEFQVNLFVLLIRRADIVLGTHWLATLGHILMDYKALTISFDWRGLRLSLQGRQPQRIEPIQLYLLERLININSIDDSFQCFTLVFPDLPSPPLAKSTSAPAISRVLAHFGDVFVMPTELPPQRLSDHQIPLQPGTSPVQVRPNFATVSPTHVSNVFPFRLATRNPIN